jgi:DNA-3-methyladenine glycosylase II
MEQWPAEGLTGRRLEQARLDGHRKEENITALGSGLWAFGLSGSHARGRVVLDSRGVSSVVDYARARRHLMRADPVIAALVRTHGACGLAERSAEPRLSAFVRALISQQLSVKAADTIFRRFRGLFAPGAFPTADQIRDVSVERLRGVGMSRPKARYVHDLCGRIDSGALDLSGLDAMSDEEVMATLTAVKGIGRWTAEMILIFQLERPDVLPVDDVGLLRAIQRAYRLRSRPSTARVMKIAEPWRPYRSVACWYLWASLDGG